MRQNLSISNRLIAIIMVIVIPFCCCSLDVCAVTNANSEGCGSCCERPASDGSTQDTDSGCTGCVGCTKAPVNPGPQLDTFTLSLEPMVHPSQASVTYAICIKNHMFTFLKDWDKPPEDDPCISARIFRTIITLQV